MILLLEFSALDVLKWGVEILVFAIGIYAFIRFAQNTQGSAVLKGFVVLAFLLIVGLFTMARFFGLDHLSFVADQGLSILLIGLVVVFQPELRQAFVRLGDARLLQMLERQNKGPGEVAADIVQACERCARRGLGVLIVVERRIGIAGFTEGGVHIDGLLSAPLLVSLFFKDTPLHDGAVVVRGRRVIAAGCVLPLSENPNLSKALGTRHRAAIGATVKVVAGAKTYMRHVQGGTGKGCQDSLYLHFGIGAAAKVDEISVAYPGGKTVKYAGPFSADQRVWVYEDGKTHKGWAPK